MTRPTLLDEAIYRLKASPAPLDANALAVLARLHADDRTPDALAAITDQATVADRIVACCIQSDVMRRDFPRMVETERQMAPRYDRQPSRTDALRKAVKDIDAFVAEVAVGPRNSLSAYIALQPGEGDHLRKALGLISGLIDARERVAAETLPRIGATNKSEGGADTAAIGWLAQGVKMITKQPHTRHVAVLAQAILDQPDVSEDRVRAALRSREKRDWRDERVVRFCKK